MRARLALVFAALGALLLSSGLVVMSASTATAADNGNNGKSAEHKPSKDNNGKGGDKPSARPSQGQGGGNAGLSVFVCKYVAQPGEATERLQTGQNPISTSVKSIKDYAGVGQWFEDVHGSSYVLAVDNTPPGPAGDPDVSACPPTSETPRAAAPTATAQAAGCVLPGGSTVVTVTVTNTDDPTDGAATYTVTRDGSLDEPKTVSVDDGDSGSVQFSGLSTGTYHFTVAGSDNTSATAGVTVVPCGADGSGTPTVTATSSGCVPPGKSTGSVVVTVTNTVDATHDSVVFTITLAGPSQTLTLADGASGSVTFTGLGSGAYTAAVSGDDGTSASTNVTVAACDDNPKPSPGQDICPNIDGEQATVPPGLEFRDGQCLKPVVKGVETIAPNPGNKPGVHKPGTTTRPAVVAGTQAAIPTGADAGLATMPTASATSVTALLAQLLVAGGLLLLVTGGYIGFGRRTRGVHEA